MKRLAVFCGLWLLAPLAAGALVLERTAAFTVEVGVGEVVTDARVLYAEREVAFVVTAQELGGSILVDVPAGEVRRVDLAELREVEAGIFELGSRGEAIGHVEREGDAIVLELGELRAVLREAPPVVGRQSPEAVKKLHPAYARPRRAKSRTALPLLKSAGREVVVWVYFASWQRTNDAFVEEILRATDAISDPNLRFELYGLSRPLTEDPEAKRLGIYGAPTAIVKVDGEEAGRITGNAWRDPIAALAVILEDSK